MNSSEYYFKIIVNGTKFWENYHFELTVQCVQKKIWFDTFTFNISVCIPGYFRSTMFGNFNCVRCPRGTYSDILEATHCTPCPQGQTTSFTGSRSYHCHECNALLIYFCKLQLLNINMHLAQPSPGSNFSDDWLSKYITNKISIKTPFSRVGVLVPVLVFLRFVILVLHCPSMYVTMWT